MEKYFYTNRNLVDVLPVDFKSFTDCGISTININQVSCEGEVHSIIEITDEQLFKSLLKNDVVYMTKSEVQVKLEELKAKEEKENEENIKNSLEYKVELLEKTVNSLKQENADLAFQMMMKEAK